MRCEMGTPRRVPFVPNRWRRGEGSSLVTRIVIMGGGPAGYEAALVAAQHGADVTIVERDGLGGACVLYDCVPSKKFIASAGARANFHNADELGIRVEDEQLQVDLPAVHSRVRGLALAQSADVRNRVQREGVRIIHGVARFCDTRPGLAAHSIRALAHDGTEEVLEADVVLISTGATPRVLPGAEPAGERLLDGRQIYDLPDLRAQLVSAHTDMGVRVTLISSRARVLPHEDADAAAVLEDVFAARGTEVVKHARATGVERTRSGVVVHLESGDKVEASHALMTVGSVPNTVDLGLDKEGLKTAAGGFVSVDRVSRT